MADQKEAADQVDRLVVVLDKDTDPDDAERIANAIRMLQGVIYVSTHAVDSTDRYARSRLRYELFEEFFSVLKEKLLKD